MKYNLICASKCKRIALDVAKEHRAHKFTRVSQDFLIECENNLRQFLINRVKSHPSVGKTLN